MRIVYTVIFATMLSMASNAQSLDELKAQKADLSGQISDLQGKLGDVQGKIDALPGWDRGTFGTVGVNLSNFSNWVNAANPNSRNITILGSLNGFANNMQDKYFWRNRVSVNLGWQKLNKDTTDPTLSDQPFTQTADVFNISSLYGHRLNSIFALSTLGEYRSTLLNKFNDPGYLDIGVGATLTPFKNLLVIFHPLNYNFIFSKDGAAFTSSLGCKLVADFTANLSKNISWRSNLSSFLSYKGLDELSNHTWTNGFSFSAWKGIGLGVEHAIRFNKQETSGLEGKSQQYYILGLTFSL